MYNSLNKILLILLIFNFFLDCSERNYPVKKSYDEDLKDKFTAIGEIKKNLLTTVLPNSLHPEIYNFLLSCFEYNTYQLIQLLGQRPEDPFLSEEELFLKVKRLLKDGAYINATNSDGKTALNLAAFWGYTRIPMLLLSYNANLDIQDNNGYTALMSAFTFDSAYKKHKYENKLLKESVASLLINNGAKLNIQNVNGTTALMLAVINDSEEMVRLLLQKKADVNISDNDGKTALIYSIANGNVEMTKLLIDYGATINIKTKNGLTPLKYATNCAELEIAELLKSKLEAKCIIL